MRALTLTQPWCGLVAAGIKLVENRPRPMIRQDDVGKRFALHASREIDETLYGRLAEIDPALDLGLTMASERWYRLSRITSAVIGVATLREILDCRGYSAEAVLADLERLGIPEQARFTFGPIVYVLADVIALENPIECRGWQGFWSLTVEQTERVNAQLGVAA